jgi:hypothetical protein
MPDDPVVPNAPQAEWNPPAADEDWSSLFGTEGEGDVAAHPQTAQTTEAEPAPVEAEPQHVEPEPQAAQPKRDEFFVATYRTKEATESAIQEKDRLINDLRGKVIALAGVDPLKARREGVSQEQPPSSYLNDPDRYAKDLTDAATGKQYRQYLEAQARLIDEVVQSRYGHLLPVMEKVGRQEAIESVVSENPSFKSFYNSEDYQKVLDTRPTLKRAIQAAESNPQFQSDLPELYKLTWDTSLAAKTPELLKSGQSTTQTVQTPRMPMSSGRLAPPVSAQGTPAKPTLNTSAGRKALMQELEAKGVLDQQF